MHCLPDKKHRHFHVSCYEPDWLAGIIVNYGLDLTKKFVSSFSYVYNQSEASELQYLCYHYWTHLTLFESFVLSLDCQHLKSLYCYFQLEY